MYKISRLKFTLVFLQTLKYCLFLCWGDWFTHVRSSMAHQIWMEYNGRSFYSHLKDRTLHMLYWLWPCVYALPLSTEKKEKRPPSIFISYHIHIMQCKENYINSRMFNDKVWNSSTFFRSFPDHLFSFVRMVYVPRLCEVT